MLRSGLAELTGPKDSCPVRDSFEHRGLDCGFFSDHFSPWLASQGHALNAWAVLGTLGQAAIAKELEQDPART